MPAIAALASPKKLTPRQEERRRRILAMTQDMVAQSGFDGVSMRAIAHASGTAEKTLYNIFGTKDRLVALTANFRSANVFDAAAHSAAAPGWARLVSYARAIAEKALEAPELSRALAVPLIDHAEAVGLDRIYARHITPELAVMLAAGKLVAEAPLETLTRAIRLAMVAAVVFWAKGELADAELLPYTAMRLAECLLPCATPAGAALIGPVWRDMAEALQG